MKRLLLPFAFLVALVLYPVAVGIGQTIPDAGVYLPLIAEPGTPPTATPTNTLVPPLLTVATNTPLPTATATSTRTQTPTPTVTPTGTQTGTPTTTGTATSTPTITPTATQTPTTTPTATPTLTPTSTTSPSFVCASDFYNCSDFGTQAAAQQVYNYCAALGFGDIHRLDGDNNGLACESLP